MCAGDGGGRVVPPHLLNLHRPSSPAVSPAPRASGNSCAYSSRVRRACDRRQRGEKTPLLVPCATATTHVVLAHAVRISCDGAGSAAVTLNTAAAAALCIFVDEDDAGVCAAAAVYVSYILRITLPANT